MRHPIRALLAALALVAGGQGASGDTLTHIGSFDWPTETVSGVSGLEVSEDGNSFVAISDRGWFLTGTLSRIEGQISGVTLTSLRPILGSDALPVAARRVGDWSDAEGLAIAADGTVWIAFERWAHVARYDALDGAAHWIRDHPSFREFDDNSQLEAAAVHPDGTVYVFSEDPLDKGFPIYRLDGKQWVIDGYMPVRNGFSVVGADFDDTGRLFVLERKLSFGLWWQNRIRLWQPGDPSADRILWTGERGAFRNLEGISVWRDGSGLRITMVSDDNGNRDEPTQFVEFLLRD